MPPSAAAAAKARISRKRAPASPGHSEQEIRGDPGDPGTPYATHAKSDAGRHDWHGELRMVSPDLWRQMEGQEASCGRRRRPSWTRREGKGRTPRSRKARFQAAKVAPARQASKAA